MTGTSYWESFKAEGATFVEQLRTLIREGNVRRIVIEQNGRMVAEFPLAAGVVGALLAPELSAIAAVVAIFKGCTIRAERTGPAADAPDPQTRVA